MDTIVFLGAVVSFTNIFLTITLVLLVYKYRRITFARMFLNVKKTILAIEGLIAVFLFLLIAIILKIIIPKESLIIHSLAGLTFQTYILILLVLGIREIWRIKHGRR